MKNYKKQIKIICWGLFIIIIIHNLLAIFHSYKFTHFSDTNTPKTNNPEKLNISGILKAFVFGVSNPRPYNEGVPYFGLYETVILQGRKKLECWYITTELSKGTIVLFHGYGGNKYSMLDKAELFKTLGYNTFMVDFMGAGGSEGNRTTIGYEEAEQVKMAFDYITKKGERNIYLYGTSMGASAILKALHDYDMSLKGIIIECPFGSMYDAVSSRFRIVGAPTFPMAGLLVFWGGLQNGFWAFGFKPTEYAKSVNVPTLLMYGAKDQKVRREEIDEIYKNIQGDKALRVYENAGHENYLLKHKTEWVIDVADFLENTNKREK